MKSAVDNVDIWSASFDDATTPIWAATDSQPRALRCNRAAAALIGSDVQSPTTLAALGAVFAADDGTESEIADLVRRTFAGAAALRLPPLELKNDRSTLLELVSEAVRAPNGRVVGVLLRAERSAASRDDAAIVQARFGWLDRVGHDLRGPLSPLRTAVQLMQSGRVPPERLAEMFELIDRQIDQLVGVIDDVSDMAKLSRGAFSCTLAPNDLRTLVDVASSRLLRPLGELGVRVTTHVPNDPVDVECDPRRLSQLLVFLLRRLGEARVEATTIECRLEIDGGDAFLRFRSSDPPLADAGIDFLATGQPSRDLGGVTMRLAILRHIAQVHSVAIAVAAGQRELRLRLPLTTRAERPLADATRFR